jgi:hypothetical protein
LAAFDGGFRIPSSISFLCVYLMCYFLLIVFDFCSMSKVGQEIGDLLADFVGRGSGSR